MPKRALKSRSRDEDECGRDPFVLGCVDAGKGRVRGSAMTVLQQSTQRTIYHGKGCLEGVVLVLPLAVGLEEHVTRVKVSCGSPRRAHNSNEQYSRERIDTQQRYHSSEFPEKCQKTASLLLKPSSEKRLGWGIEGGICRAVVETACAGLSSSWAVELLIGQWVCCAAS